MRRWANDEQRKAVMTRLKSQGGIVSVPRYEPGGGMHFEHFINGPRPSKVERVKKLFGVEPKPPGWIVEAEREHLQEERQKARAAKQAQGQGQGQVQLSPEQVRALIQAKKHQAQTESEAEEE